VTTFATSEAPAADLARLTSGELARLSPARGVDHATRLLYDAVRAHNADFLHDLDRREVDRSNLPKLGGRMLIAPAAFFREHPKFAGDGRTVREVSDAYRIRTEIIPSASTGSVSQNAEIIADYLERVDDRVMVASLSKGGADLRIALEQAPHLAKKIRVWINICGLVRGTPIHSSLLGSRWWQKGMLKGYLAYTRAHPSLVSELSAAPDSLLGKPPRLPPGLRIINVLGFPLREHLFTRNAKTRHHRMAHLGPNDGTALLRDSIFDNSHTCPVWGADHFLRTPEVTELFYRLFLYTQDLP
jgi:hypothetical protein